MHVELRTEAISDLVEAAWFYERQGRGLGEQFSDAIFSHLAYLETVAGGHEVVFGAHRMLARRFPYAVDYKVNGEKVDVVAILDCRRDPGGISRTLTNRTAPHQGSDPPETKATLY